MRITYIYIILLFASPNSFSQNQNSIWIFGDSAGIDFNIINNPIPISSGMVGRGSCVSYADSLGNLQLYAASLGYLNSDWNSRIFNNQHQIVQGCDSITGESWYNELVFIPRPLHINQYYLFSIGNDPPNNQGCYYTLVDMNANGGAGQVLQQNNRINPSNSADCLTAIKHGNGRDWWIINKYSSGGIFNQYNRFYIYLVTPDSIYPPSVIDFNDARDVDIQKIIWNNKSNRFMLIMATGYMSEFNFDRCTGYITWHQNIFPEQTSNYNRRFWEGAYAPNDSLFYVSTTAIFSIDSLFLIQYNLYASDIVGTADTIDRFLSPIIPGALRLAPNNKIYLSCGYACNALVICYPYPDSVRNYVNENLSVINQPNNIGVACDYQPFSFNLGGKRTYYGLPNNPNYILGPLVGSSCDSLSTSITEIQSNPKLQLFHHYVWQKLFVNAENLKGKNCILEINDISGRQIYRYSSVTAPPYFTSEVSTSSWSTGVYLVSLSTEKERLTGKFVKE